jgi:hypothetical protein
MTLAGRLAGRTPADVVLVARMLAWFIPMPLIRRVISLPRLARIMWAEPRDLAATPEQQRRIAAAARFLVRWRTLGRDGNCLNRSLVNFRFLSKADLTPRLVLGVRTDGGRVEGHAWVTVKGEPVGESSSSVERFVPIAVFGPGGEPERISPQAPSAAR